MSRDWSSILRLWSAGPSKAEDQRISNTLKQIKEAIKNHDMLSIRDINVFTQGSYMNRVNVRNESDIDIGVLCYDTFFPDYSDNNIKALVENKFTDSTYSFKTFKKEIEEALVNKFGRSSVTRGNKAFDIKANTYRVEADVAPFFEHRRYITEHKYLSGVQLLPDNGSPNRIINWPDQHYANGTNKNEKTQRRYKRIVRILKKLSIEMEENKIILTRNIPGFLIECLVWNVPNDIFLNSNSYVNILRETLLFLFNNTKQKEYCNEWGEVSELKYLFRDSQSWSYEYVHFFISEAWKYIGFN